jgi:hypothetical protein
MISFTYKAELMNLKQMSELWISVQVISAVTGSGAVVK